MWVIVLAIVLRVSGALSPALLKPGALTGHLGRVHLVEDALWITYPHVDLVEIPAQLQGVVATLDNTMGRLRQGMPGVSGGQKDVLFLLHARLIYINETITSAVEAYEGLGTPHRTKRGLIDGIGKLSRMLFGTAMNEDVEDLRDRYNQLLAVARANNKAINLNCRNIVRLEKQIRALAVFTNNLTTSINGLFKRLDAMDERSVVSHSLAVVENLVTSLLDTNQKITRNIVDAAMGRVTTSLFPIKDFRHTLEVGRTVYKLSPLFDEHNIHHYYPLVESVLTSDAIVIHVPFKSQDVFELYQVEPFPFSLNNSVMVLDSHSSIVLVKDDFSVYATSQLSTLDSCRSEYESLYFCPASLFAFLPTSGDGVCEVVLTRGNASAALTLCPYKQLVPKVMFHKSFHGHHYFFFTKQVYVSVACPNGSSYEMVSGHFAVLTVCTLSSDHFNTFPEKYHQGFISSINSHIFPIDILDNLTHMSVKFVTNTLSEFTFANISDFESAIHESLPMYLSPAVHFSSLIVPIIVVCIILIPLCCCVKRATSLYFVLQARLNKQRVNTDDSKV